MGLGLRGSMPGRPSPVKQDARLAIAGPPKHVTDTAARNAEDIAGVLFTITLTGT